jgi:Holliday junction DNA helicase RuvA
VIAWLRGVLRDKRPPRLVLDVRGVGYELEAPMTTFYDLPETGAEVSLYTHQIVRDDAHSLYAFGRVAERDTFRMLLKVNGVGAKVALAILSGMDAARLSRCVHEADTASLSKLPGIGKKTAERLIIEMRDRLDPPGTVPAGMPSPGPATVGLPAHDPAHDPVGEAVNALVALGLKPPEASRRVGEVAEEGLACEDIVRRALQAMVQ